MTNHIRPCRMQRSLRKLASQLARPRNWRHHYAKKMPLKNIRTPQPINPKRHVYRYQIYWRDIGRRLGQSCRLRYQPQVPESALPLAFPVTTNKGYYSRRLGGSQLEEPIRRAIKTATCGPYSTANFVKTIWINCREPLL